MYNGIILHVIAKVLFIFGSYTMHYFLGKFLLPEEYGNVGVIITIINFGYLFLNNGVRQAISKDIAQKKINSKEIIKKGIAVQAFIVFTVVTVTLLGAEKLSIILGDEELLPYIKMTGSIIPFMGLYFAMLGIFNGFQMFKIETGILIIYPILKLCVIPLVYYSDDTIFATEMGFLISAIVICIICLFFLVKNINKDCLVEMDNKGNWIDFIKSSLSFSFIFIATSIIMNIDTLLVKAYVDEQAEVGYYTAVVNFSKIPYYLLTAVFLVLLPVISQYYSEGKIEIARKSIKDILNTIFALVLPIVIIIISSASKLLQLFYEPEYIEAKYALVFLMIGTFFLGMAVLLNMIISAIDKKLFTMIIAVFMIVSEIILCICLIPRWGINGAAMANLCTSFVAFIVSFVYLIRIFGVPLHGTMVINIIISLCFGFLGHCILSWTNIQTLFLLVLTYALLYLGQIVIELLFKTLDFRKLLKK